MQAAQSDRPSTWGETFAGVIIFIQFPLFYYFSRFFLLPAGNEPSPSGWLIELAQVLLFLGVWSAFPLLGFAIGWMKGFPRWVYPYVVFSLLSTLYLMNASTPGISVFGYPLFGREDWGTRACIPGLLMAVVTLVLARSVRSLLVFFENGWKDWTRFTFALFGVMPLVNFISFDEIPVWFEMPVQVGLVMIMVLAAAAYLRSATPTRRALSLVAGFGLCVLVDAVAPTLYWLESGWVDIASLATYAITFMVIVFLPAIIGLAHHLTHMGPRETR